MTSKESRPVLRGLVGSNAHPATQLVDFLVVLFGYAISGERTLEEFYERLQPFAVAFMAGAGAGSVALPFGALALFSSPDGRTRRNAARAFSR